MPEDHGELFELPADLKLIGEDQEVQDLLNRAVAEFDRVDAIEEVTPELLEYQFKLKGDIDRIKVELAARVARAAQAEQNARTQQTEARERLRAAVHPDRESVTAGDGGGVDMTQLAETVAKASAQGVAAGMAAVFANGKRSPSVDPVAAAKAASTSLAAAAAHVPDNTPKRPALAITAGVEVRDRQGRPADIATVRDLADAYSRTAKQLPPTRDGSGRRVLIASMENRYEHSVDDRTSLGDVQELLNYLNQPQNHQALVAGGGWCAPSEYRYDFFNVACVDGLVDLPTVGINRGGIQVPVSPSLADTAYAVSTGTAGLGGFGATFSSASDPWLWTETDDIATVTGNPNKPTLRVPCPTFTGYRLECYGITLTAGNLTDDAYPEATANTLRLLMAAWQHAKNARIISQMVTASTAAITISGGGNRPAYNQVLSGLDLAATDYRAKFGMCDDDVLEVVAPYWLADVIVADLAWRTNVELLSVSEAQITGYFADRNLRVQWVSDWQVRGAGQFGNPAALPGGAMTAWPATASVMIYAAGTFLLGNGLSLDLGVVRDSTLNAENDFTAAWSEECHLVAKIGHESRLYTIGFTVNGAGVAALPVGAYI